MLRVRIEVVPFGEESLKEEIRSIIIANTGDHPNSPYDGHYFVWDNEQSFELGDPPATRVADFARVRGAEELVQEALRALLRSGRIRDPLPYRDGGA